MDELTTTEERFRAYLDGELSAEERGALEAELARTPELAEEFAAYRRTVELLRALPFAPPPDDFVDRVEARIRRRTHGRYFRAEPRLRFPYEAAATVLLMIASVAVFLYALPAVERPTLPPPPESLAPEGAVGAEFRELVSALRALGTVERDGGSLLVRIPKERLLIVEGLARDLVAIRRIERRTLPDGETLEIRLVVREEPPPATP